jgi:hypothetical protein
MERPMTQEMIEKLSWHTGRSGQWKSYELIYNPHSLLCFQANCENLVGISETKFLSVPANGRKIQITSHLTGDYFQDDDKYMIPGHFSYELDLKELEELKEVLELDDKMMEEVSKYNKKNK